MFDPSKKRRYYLEGGLNFVLRTEFDPKRPMGNIAVVELADVIRASLVGMHAEIAPILPRALEWLDYAIQTGEELGEDRNFHCMLLHSARALGHWLASSSSAEDDWTKAMQFEQAYWSTESPPMTPKRIVGSDSLDDYMAFSIQAGKFDEALQTYDALVPARKLSLGRKLKPYEYAYAICLAQLKGEFNEAELFEAGRRVLQTMLEDKWLGMGQLHRAAMWLKIVHWDKDIRASRVPALTPLQTLLKAYENMPNVARPEHVGT